jgi:hypothetical protein
MTTWLVTCGRCPYRERFHSEADSTQAMVRHQEQYPDHNPQRSQEER